MSRLQGLHHALHAHEARTFDQHSGHFFCGGVHLLLQSIHAVEMPRSLKSVCAVLRQFTQSEQLIDAARLGIGTDFVMELGSLLTHFAHVAQHQQPRAWRERQQVNGRTH